MIGRSDLDRGFSARRDSGEPYAEFHPDGSLSLFSFSRDGSSIQLRLEPGGAGSSVERSRSVSFEDEDGGTDPEAFDEWARHWIGRVYDRAHGILRCAFCGKGQEEVAKLIAAPEDVYICDECVTVCARILESS